MLKETHSFGDVVEVILWLKAYKKFAGRHRVNSYKRILIIEDVAIFNHIAHAAVPETDLS